MQPLHLSVHESAWRESNPQAPVPETGGLPSSLHADESGGTVGIEPTITVLRAAHQGGRRVPTDARPMRTSPMKLVSLVGSVSGRILENPTSRPRARTLNASNRALVWDRTSISGFSDRRLDHNGSQGESKVGWLSPPHELLFGFQRSWRCKRHCGSSGS